MKIKQIISVVALCVLCIEITSCKPRAKITIHVVTDKGQSISDFPISLSTFDHWQPGEGFGHDISIGYNQKTDAQGLVNFTIPSPRGGMSFGTPYNIKGYYPNIIHYQFKTNTDGKWQPWNPTIDLIVKPITNPIPMYARNVGVMGFNLTLPAKNTPIGFDLETADFVAPYGKGATSDFIFNLNDDTAINDQKPMNKGLTLTFPNKGDGIQSMIVSQKQGNTFRMLSDAPRDGYESILILGKDSQYTHGLLREDQNYFFRVRTVLDEQGNVKSALYGKIRGPIQFWDNAGLEFTYYLNPTPNDRNMEFDPSKNLFKNLDILQQVKAP